MLVLLGTLWLACVVLESQAISCCRNASGFDACKHRCNELESEADVSLRYQKLRELPKHCPGHLIGFWRCLNASNPGISLYIGTDPSNFARTCCLLPLSLECRKACREGKLDLLRKKCSEVEESAMFRCVDRHEASRNCCKNAAPECIKSCQVVFSSEQAPSILVKKSVSKYCSSRRGRHVITCVQNMTADVKSCVQPTDTKPKVLKCCRKAADLKCKQTCRQEFQSTNVAIANLMKSCGQPLGFENKNNDMWKCFLSNSEKRPAPVCPTGTPPPSLPASGIDGARLQCCSKASKSVCWRLCVQMYTSKWGKTQNWQAFDAECVYDPSEISMMNCLADVAEPCQLGCKGLSFCTNFNNRHTELFRSCNSKSDHEAKHHLQEWTKGVIQMPNVAIPIKDIRKCLPDTWKAIACVLQIKPCSVKSHRSTICRPDCVQILQKCRNASTQLGAFSPEKVCSELSPEDQAHCISIKDYLVPSKYPDVTDEVTHPCHPNPCGKNEVCDINRSCYGASLDKCTSRTCVPGCPLGEASSFLVRMGEYARVPVASGRDGCFRICHCDATSKLSDCRNLDCVRREPCEVGGGVKKADGELFTKDCNFCVCFSGELTCTKMNCAASVLSPDYNASRPKRNQTPDNDSLEDTEVVSSLPCGCGSVFHPVCGSDAKTYPNPCVARCHGLSDSMYVTGGCASIDPCLPNPCAPDEKCIVERKTCLSMSESCSQFYCVSEGKYCSDLQLDPVCDTENRQHPNLCSLQFNRKRLAYRGFCKDECKPPAASVCGVNGDTYISKCAAHSSRVIVDYQGPCKAVGVGNGDGPRCKDVRCPEIRPTHCKGIVPPGACCPHCAAQVRVLYSRMQLGVNKEGFSRHESVTLEQVLLFLRRHVSTTECDLFGYYSLQGDIVVLVMAVTDRPTRLQVEACNREAQRVEAFVNTATPSFTSDIVLSALKGARSKVPTLSDKPEKPVSDSPRSKASRVNNALIATLLPIIVLPVMLRTGRS